MSTGSVSVAELPTYLLKPLTKSRVKGHVQTLAFMQFSTSAGFLFELAVSENVWASRRFSSDGKWSKWEDKRVDSFDAAWVAAQAEIIKLGSRGYRSLVSQPLLVPMNETDVRHLRSESLLPRHALDYGSDLLDSVREYVEAEHKRIRDKLAASGVTMPSAPAAPTAAPGSGSPIAPIVKEMGTMVEEVEKAAQERGKLGSVAEAGF